MRQPERIAPKTIVAAVGLLQFAIVPEVWELTEDVLAVGEAVMEAPDEVSIDEMLEAATVDEVEVEVEVEVDRGVVGSAALRMFADETSPLLMLGAFK